MNLSAFFRGVAGVVKTDVDSIFTKVNAAVAAAPFIPANLKADLLNTSRDSQADIDAAEVFAGELVGQVIADGVDDTTTLLMNTANALSNGRSLAEISVAEKNALLHAWNVMKAQGDTIVAQLHAGIDPTKSAPKPA